jgi:acetyltransferase
MASSGLYSSYDLNRHVLDAIFKPRSVAVIGATERANSVGHTVMVNLTGSSLEQPIYPVNLRRDKVLGLPAYRKIKAVPEPVDLAIIATPAYTVPRVVRECVAAGVKGAIILSAGFREMGPAGLKLEQLLLKSARRGKMRILGPNCLGVMNPLTGLNATFVKKLARPGNVAFISQSGALANAVLDWSQQSMVGFSAFVSIGAMLDIQWSDLITYFGKDYQTKSIVIYMESVGQARAFLSAVREVAFNKPIIVLKAGRTEAAAQAAASHTGALAGSDAVLDAAFRRGGVLRVETIADLFAMAEVLAKQPRPRGPRLTILTNAGGPGILAMDTLLANGGHLATLATETIEALDQFLPAHWSQRNPIDIVGDADPQRFGQAIAVGLKDQGSDGLLVILAPQDRTDPSGTAEVLSQQAATSRKPILASWMGGAEVAAGRAMLNEANIPTFAYPDTAVKVFSYMWQYNQNLRSLYETPTLPPESQEFSPDRSRARQLIDPARQAGRTILSELESKQLLAAYGLPTVETRLARSSAEAVQQAEAIGYPVVLKVHSEAISHKAEVGGVQLNLATAAAVERAYSAIKTAVTKQAGGPAFLGVTVQPMIGWSGYELILGSSLDPHFGPVILFGLGGGMTDVFKDQALELPPLTSTLARRLIERTRIYSALQGLAGPNAVDLAMLEQLLVRFSQLIVEQRGVLAIDLNPFFVAVEGMLALDAQVQLQPKSVKVEALPALAIRPYPRQYVTTWQLKDGSPVTIRPIRAEDETLMAKLHETLSDATVYSRFFRNIPLSRRIAHERLSRICFVDYDQEMALVVEYHHPDTAEVELLGVGRLIKQSGTEEAEFSVLVGDAWQGQGIGSKLLSLLVDIGRQENISRIIGTILPENSAMQQVSRKLGFTVTHSVADRLVMASLELSSLN